MSLVGLSTAVQRDFWQFARIVAEQIIVRLVLQYDSRGAKNLTIQGKVKMIRYIVFIFALLLLVNPVWARDERSIKELSKALAGLAHDVHRPKSPRRLIPYQVQNSEIS